mgnify:CR=1 FL=1
MQTKKCNQIKIHELLTLPGVGTESLKQLIRLKINTLKDLLFHLPMRYEDRTTLTPLNKLRHDETMLCEGVIIELAYPKRGRTKLLCVLQDSTGNLNLRFFHVLSFQKKQLQVGVGLRCFGIVRFGHFGPEMIHPTFEVITGKYPLPLPSHYTPVYSLTHGLQQKSLYKIIQNALLIHSRTWQELLPFEVLQPRNLPLLYDALKFVHQPPKGSSLIDLTTRRSMAHRRIVFEELIAHRLSLLQLKKLLHKAVSIPLPPCHQLIRSFLKLLPFTLTNAQNRAIEEICEELTLEKPMLRLLQGDVGSGKTVVAAISLLQAVGNHHQAVLMAPTEILAEQHFQTLQQWFKPLGVTLGYLSGNISHKSRHRIYQEIAQGEIKILVGTQALFQQKVQFADLAVIIVDEQHRFGVTQRALLRDKNNQDKQPHQLIMTATPIPRTLAMNLYAGLDCTTLDEIPPGRIPVATSVIPNEKRTMVIDRVREVCRAGRQVYWVCPLIEDSEIIRTRAAVTTAEILRKYLSECKIGLVHGKLVSAKKASIMRAFAEGDLQILVATTVIEVGIDVPNASIIIIENAESLGLAQLHQLRGRVGRGKISSHCILLYQSPLSDIAKARLKAMRETSDGFLIAQRDLELRGPGEILGTKQTGALSFIVSDIVRDQDLLSDVQEVADYIMNCYPELIEPLIARWIPFFSLENYEKVVC